MCSSDLGGGWRRRGRAAVGAGGEGERRRQQQRGEGEAGHDGILRAVEQRFILACAARCAGITNGHGEAPIRRLVILICPVRRLTMDISSESLEIRHAREVY